MARVEKLVAGMRRNPNGDWTISDVEMVCRSFGIACTAPSGGGSHYGLKHPRVSGRLTIPARRPIKPIYIRLLLDLIDILEA